eukprot:g6309.t1
MVGTSILNGETAVTRGGASGADAVVSEESVAQRRLRRVLRRHLGRQVERIRRQSLQLEEALRMERERERDAKSLAWLRGQHVLFVMRDRKVLLGRDTKAGCRVDMDLSEEGDAMRVSRRHAIISLKRNCRFYIRNIGLRAFDVNGREVKPGGQRALENNSLLSICGLAFSFEINTALHAKIRKQLKVGAKEKKGASGGGGD